MNANDKPKKKLALRKISITKLSNESLSDVVGGPPSRTDCAPPRTGYECSWPCIDTRVPCVILEE